MVATAAKSDMDSLFEEDTRELAPSSGRRTTEVRQVDKTTGAAKGSKLARFSLIPPKCLWELAEHYGKGSLKYADRNWEKGYDWHLSYDALGRHLLAFWMGEDIDPETGSHHLIAVAWHAFCLRTFLESHPEKDDRPDPVELPPDMPNMGELISLFNEKFGG